MTAALPRLPDRTLLADLCREAAARERVQPQLIEKDFYLTRILWALGQSVGDGLLLKGGTSLFIGLVDEKLAELRALPMAKQSKSFGLTEERRREVEAGLRRDLPAVLRSDAPVFDLDGMLAQFDRLWRR